MTPLFSKKKNTSGHILTKPKYSYFHMIGRDYVVDWLSILLLSVLMIIFFVSIGYVKYVSSISVMDSTSDLLFPTNPLKFSVERLNKLLGKYEERQKISKSVLSGDYNIPNPGI